MAAPFRLARVLRLREQIRRLRTHEAEQLAAQLAAVHVATARIVEERERRGLREAEEARLGLLTPDGLQVSRAYDAALAVAEKAHVAEGTRLGLALAAKRAELLRERQEEEKYVRLAAAHRSRVLEDEAREAERSLDEIAVDRHRRNQKERGHDRV
jgi:flagellar biosynthesis chaperone FliJ